MRDGHGPPPTIAAEEVKAGRITYPFLSAKFGALRKMVVIMVRNGSRYQHQSGRFEGYLAITTESTDPRIQSAKKTHRRIAAFERADGTIGQRRKALREK
jgi:hypothetical protein